MIGLNRNRLNVRGLNLHGDFQMKKVTPSGSRRLMVLDGNSHVYVQLTTGEYITLNDM